MKKSVFVLPILALSVLIGTVAAATFFGFAVVDSHGAFNPNNILDEDDDFAVVHATLVTECPDGDIDLVTVFNGTDNVTVCEETDSGKQFGGWIVVDMTNGSSAIENITALEFLASEKNLSCGSNCNNSAAFRAFATGDLNGNQTDWQFVGNCIVADNEQNKTCSFSPPNNTTDVEGYLVGRGTYNSAFPAPAIHWGKVTN